MLHLTNILFGAIGGEGNQSPADVYNSRRTRRGFHYWRISRGERGGDILLFLTDCFVYAGLIGRVQGDGALAPRRGHST